MRAEFAPSLRRVWLDHRRGLLVWSVALAAITVFYLAFWPMMGEEMMAALEGMPEGLMAAMGYDRIGSAAGYLEAVVYGLLGPVLLLVYGIGLGGRLIAGQEEDGTLELELAAPVSRIRVYAERLAAAWLLLVTLVAAATLAVLVSGPLFDLGVPAGHVFAASGGLLLLVGGFTTLSFALGAARGRRGVAVGTAAAIAAVAYVFRGIANAAGIDVLGAVSPMAWMLDPEPLVRGADVVSLVKLAAISVVAAPLGAWAFARRDLMT
jgi:ABC-2 type transport system permease protein